MSLLSIISIISLVTFLGTAVALPVIVASLPADYFVHPHAKKAGIARRILECLGGAVLIASGIVLLFVPGQGILTILLGVLLAAGHRRSGLLRTASHMRRMQSALNAIRIKFGKKPFTF